VPAPRRPEIDGRLDGIVWLDQPILAPRTLAGRTYDVRIAERPILLTLPKDGPRELVLSQANPPLPIRPFPRPPLAPALTPNVHVASGMSTPLPPQVLAVTAFRLRWDDDALESSFGTLGGTEQFGAALDTWLTTVQDWLAAWSGSIRETAHQEGPPHFRIAAVRQPDAPAEGGGGRVPVVTMGQRSLSAHEIHGAFAAASAGHRLPLQHQLLAEARVLVARAAAREAVIAACSAAEIALSDAARQALREAGASEADARATLKGVSGIVELYRLNATRPGGLPVSIGNVKANLAGPRNEAVHAGLDLDDNLARRALDTARRLVSLSPLPTPRALMRTARNNLGSESG
jgi:hypothetical protein